MALQAFTFANAQADLERFMAEAQKWKPAEYDDRMRLRLEYYLNQQRRDTLEQLKKIFQKTWDKQVPYYVGLTRFLVNQRALAFLESTTFELVDKKGNPLPTDGELTKWWQRTLEESGLLFKLRMVDRYTELLRTTFLLPYRDSRTKRRGFRIYFPQNTRIVFDSEDPTDLDLAYGVAFEVANQGGVQNANDKGRRWNWWCGRDDNPRMLIVNGDGTIENADGDGTNPIRGTDGKTMVPAVMFLADTEEIGAFSLAEENLVEINRALNVAKTDEHGIARAQGYGQLVAEVPDGATPPTTMVRGPDQVLIAEQGIQLKVLNGNPLLDALDEMIQKDIKLQAMLGNVAPGSVSLEGHAVASGVALQIERQPLTEQRKDRLQLYKGAIQRLWRVFRAVHNTYAKEDNLPVIPDDVELSPKWGDLDTPSDPKVQQDVELLDLANDLTTQAKILSKREGMSIEEAKRILEENRQENQATGASRAAAAAVLAGGAGRGGTAALRAEQAAGASEGNQQPGTGGPLSAARAKLKTPRQQVNGQE